MSFNPKNILVIGAGHGLGLAIAKECQSRYPQAKVVTTYRLREKAEGLFSSGIEGHQINPLLEGEVKAFCGKLDSIDFVINCVGMLARKELGPEKSLRDIDVDHLTEVFQVNSFVTPLWAKHLKHKFSKETPSVFASLSAMVGSIGENEIGGWYGYRASKTALNMFLKTISIEFERSRLKTSVVAIHPGTTKTELSEDFLKGVQHKIWEPSGAAQNILNVLESCPNEGTGLFKNWDGRAIAN
jgi:NAD(P)-dependent dehydrogenase (short-subunit alcohol dehydrogenase family)